MRNLREVLDAQKDDAVVLVRDFRAFVEINSATVEHVIVQATLDRTAVVYPPGRVDAKRVVRLDRIRVAEADIKWVPRNPRELQNMRARAIGRRRGKLAQEV